MPLAMGRPAICPCGFVALWTGEVQGDQNSQQVADWYTLSHLVHGLLFYAVARAALPCAPVAARLLAALVMEGAWEVLENTPMVIDRYRAATLAFGYSGDSVLNSMSDIGAMALGFWAAVRLSWRESIVLAAALELVSLVAIRDNLTLNVLMLVHPVEVVRAWQAG